MLVNPTGHPGKFRGVDWVEESMINLYTKARPNTRRNYLDLLTSVRTAYIWW
jgi:hypothetical protein